MVPTCSAYARDAVHRHGWLAGWILTCERLIRCGRDETHLSPVVIHNHQLRTWDPVQANVWLGKEPSP
jgi:putative component of membrane protein insertase Oxa1/YidC/SpoIIIJ protein YidD